MENRCIELIVIEADNNFIYFKLLEENKRWEFVKNWK